MVVVSFQDFPVWVRVDVEPHHHDPSGRRSDDDLDPTDRNPAPVTLSFLVHDDQPSGGSRMTSNSPSGIFASISPFARRRRTAARTEISVFSASVRP